MDGYMTLNDYRQTPVVFSAPEDVFLFFSVVKSGYAPWKTAIFFDPLFWKYRPNPSLRGLPKYDFFENRI